MKKKIAFIVPYPIGLAPSQRFRYEQYLNLLEQNGYEVSCFPFLTLEDYHLIYNPGKYFHKIWSIVRGFIKRFVLMLRLKQYAAVYIHREASPIGPPIFERIISKWFKKKIIYDFDDAIWLQNTSQSNKMVSTFKKHSKVASICEWSSLVICGNQFLVEFAKKYNNNVVYFPTTIDTDNLHNQTKKHNQNPVTLGWTGTHSTIKYLLNIEDILVKKQNEFNFTFKIISNQDPLFKSLKYDYIPWKKESEIEDLLSFDIGLMPLFDDQWSKGKCGFKALQYMALGIPSIVSPVGVNSEIIDDGINGYLAETNEDWEIKLSSLINSQELRVTLGNEGKKTVIKKYSVKANKDNYLMYFNEIINKTK